MDNVALLLIDLQKGFDDPSWGSRNNPMAEEKAASLLSYWRSKSWPVIHVQHCSLEPGSPLATGQPGCEFRDETKPLRGERQFRKSVNSAFIGTGLEKHLRSNRIDSLVIAGLTTDHCVSTTTRMAGNLGFDVTLVSDATATFDRKGHDGAYHSAEEIHAIHLASLNNEFCLVKSTAEVLIDNTLENAIVTVPLKFNPTDHTIGLSRDLAAYKVREQADPPIPVDGMTFGVASMSENSPHAGEMHSDGDEVLYLISGRARVVFLDKPQTEVEMMPSDGLVVPRGKWHRVDILEPCQIVYLTPGPNNEFRPLSDET